MSAEGLDTFVPLMKVSKGFDELRKVVIDQGICSGCSTCVAFCERIKLDEDGNAAEAAECTIKQGSISCSDEGTCYDVCPMVSHSKAELDETVFGTRREDDDLGVYKRVIAVRAKKPEILEKGQDGGAATAFLAAGLEGGLFDGAVFATRDQEWRTEAALATTPEEVMAGGGTKYARTPTTMRWGKSLRETKRLAMVGTGCQTHGARRAMTGLLRNLIEKTKDADVPVDLTLIGLFCFENFPYGCMRKAVEEKFGVSMAEIVKTDITKGKFIITTKDGEEKSVKVKDFDECVPESCKLCTNFTAEYADLSCGSIGTEAGWSTVIVRTERGEEMVKKAEELGYIEVSDEVDLEPVRKNKGLKEKIRGFAVERRTKEGAYVPEYD
ncbi:MAG: hypothetical protein GXO65_01850 [Euryarchaeota archaeon]|nr:hypothetical protein [Euryarchaeota archaeon]